MNKSMITKLSCYSKPSNRVKTSADYVMNANFAASDDLVLNYLANFQGITTSKIYTSNEYMQFYNQPYMQSGDCYGEEEVIRGEEVDNKLHERVEKLLSQRKSYRNFHGTIEKNRLLVLLGSVLKDRENGEGGSHRVYPSGGALYPIRVLLHISGVAGMEDGLYLYSHQKEGVQYCHVHMKEEDIAELLCGQLITFENSRVIIFYVYDFLQNYIKYYDIALSLAFIEVGAISQTIQLIAPECGIGYCDIGGFPKRKLETKLKLNKEYYHIIHVGVLGGI